MQRLESCGTTEKAGLDNPAKTSTAHCSAFQKGNHQGIEGIDVAVEVAPATGAGTAAVQHNHGRTAAGVVVVDFEVLQPLLVNGDEVAVPSRPFDPLFRSSSEGDVGSRDPGVAIDWFCSLAGIGQQLPPVAPQASQDGMGRSLLRRNSGL